MKLKFIHSSLFYKILFVLSLAVLIFISSVTYKHIKNLSSSTNSVIHSYKISLELEQLISYLKDAETGIRGYVITRDSSFLAPYNGSREKINNSFITLKKLTLDNKVQHDNLNMLYVLMNKKFDNFNYTLEHNVSFEYNHEKKFDKNFILGKVIMDSIRKQIDIMTSLEKDNLKIRNENYSYQTYLTPIFVITIIFLTLALMILSYIKIIRDVKTLQSANDRLMFAKETSELSEYLSNNSSWIWNLETNKRYFSDNHFRIFGCEPQSFDPTVESHMEFYHPDDIPAVKAVVKRIMETGEFETFSYRIIQKNTGEIRYLKSYGKLIQDSLGQRNLVGTTSDITDQRLASLKIEERNAELERSNQELASFNHVASHDLQEPLRKIQTFISRFSDEDKERISDTGRSYLQKIEDSASRMRILIDDLLMFSRTNKSEKVFSNVNLNAILESSKQELSQVISDKNAIITSDTLPELSAISFQMQQIFTNLIGNSLKYSKETVAPKIDISCDIVSAEDYPMLNTDSKNKYYKISFADNGMGFDSQYADKIFVLFNRLHPINNYPGTGIGLTICKKIAENHKGFIFADGTPDVGATFTLFLPVNN